MDFGEKTSAAEFLAPVGYTGLYGFHKYWGKKPAETVSFLIERLSNPQEIVLDPFLGSGAIARESYLRKRRFLGCDINPSAVALARLVTNPPPHATIASAFRTIASQVKCEIDNQYLLQDGSVGSHFLWSGKELRSVWTKPIGQRTRHELKPTPHDLALFERQEGYEPISIRHLRIFMNSRINARSGMDWSHLFTGRATRSIELLRNAILSLEDPVARQALLLVLTAAVGQMSRMVFAIERRGKVNGTQSSARVEVGSWVIGFWTPELHFEINAWNCFANKANKLLLALSKENPSLKPAHLTAEPIYVTSGRADLALSCQDACSFVDRLPNGTIDLVVTDPPHGDRIPYLEMSEIWNAILGEQPSYEQELIVSNARERHKDLPSYSAHLCAIFETLAPKLTKNGIVAILFNSRSSEEWRTLVEAVENAGLMYRGRVPMAYSAKSVVQDSREGALEHDYVVIFSASLSSMISSRIGSIVRDLPLWSSAKPQ